MTLLLDSEPTAMDYTTLSLIDVSSGLDGIAREARAAFGALDAKQLNWQPGAKQWSVAQCLEHLLTTNRLMTASAAEAMKGPSPRSVWQRLPLLPGILGGVMVRSQSPGAQRKFVSPPQSTPAASAISADVVERFVRDCHKSAIRLRSVGDREAARAIMTSPFVRFIAYNVLDGWRLVSAHNRRHVEQARRVTQSAGFPPPA